MSELVLGTVRLSRSEGVAVLALDRPARMNAVDSSMHEALRAALDLVESDSSIASLVLTGTGSAFCAGQDLAERRAMLAEGEVDLQASLDANYNPLIRRLVALPYPTIAAVNGIAAGAGAALALACDIVIAATAARFQFSFAKVALGPDSGTSYILPRLIGQARALAVALTAEPISAEQAVGSGMIYRTADPAQLMNEALSLAADFANGPRAALAAIKAQMRRGLDRDLDACLNAERDAQGALGLHPHYREAVTAFADKRVPVFATAR